MKVKFCPRCMESDLIPFGGGVMGIWQCKKCGFMGSIFPEKIVDVKKITKRYHKNDRPPHLKRRGLAGRRFWGCSELKTRLATTAD